MLHCRFSEVLSELDENFVLLRVYKQQYEEHILNS